VPKVSLLLQTIYLFTLGIIQLLVAGVIAFIDMFLVRNFGSYVMSQPTPNAFLWLMFACFLITFFAPITSAIFAFRQSKKLMKQGLDCVLPPIIWGVISFFFWLPGFAIFLFFKRYYFTQKLSIMNPELHKPDK